MAETKARQGTLPEQELDQLLAAMAQGRPWREALEQLDLPTLSGKRFWFSNLDKARFYWSLPVPARRRAIDIGAGSGVIAQGLAGHFDQVLALEHDPGWCRFIQRRLAQEGVGNAAVVRGSATTMPLPRDTFDLAVVNGVLEWIPEADRSRGPREVQRRFLENIRASLTADGVLGIAIENRLYVNNFAGYAPHDEPPFAVILPRPLANWLTRRRQQRDYRTWIYGYGGYRRLLREAGFRDIRISAVLPTYHEPREVLSMAQARAARPHFPARHGPRAWLLDVLAGTGLLGYVVHSFYISARK